jgi:hypothetical protein
MKMSKLKLPSIAILILAFFGVVILLSMYNPESAGMKAMLANPVANMQLITARETYRFQEDKDKVLGKPVYAKVRVEYEPIDNYTKGDVYDEIVEIVEKSGWERDSYSADRDDYYSGLQYYEYGSLRRRLEVAVGYKKDGNGIWVSLDAR